MNNIQFTHEDVNYTIKYQGGRPDKYSIEFTDSVRGLTKRFNFKRLVIDAEKEEIITVYDVQFYAANGERVIIPSQTSNEIQYKTTLATYLQWVALMGPILMPMLSDNICEDVQLPKQYEAVVLEISQGLMALSAEVNV